MTVEDLINKLQKFPRDMEVGRMWDRECGFGMQQEMCARAKSAEIRAVTYAGVLCDAPDAERKYREFTKAADMVVIL